MNEQPIEATSETPRGLATTEFWLVLLSNIITVALAAFEQIDAAWAAVAVTVLTALYALLRSAIKTKILSK